MGNSTQSIESAVISTEGAATVNQSTNNNSSFMGNATQYAEAITTSVKLQVLPNT